MEKVSVTLGEPSPSIRGTAAMGESRTETLTIRGPGSVVTSGLSGSGTYYSNDGVDSILGVFNFAVQDGAAIERVFLKLNQLPWQATAKTAEVSGVTSETESLHTLSVSGQTAESDSHFHNVTTATSAAGPDFSMVSLGSGSATGVSVSSTKSNTDISFPTSMTITSGGAFANDGLFFHLQVVTDDTSNDDYRFEIDILGAGGGTTSVPFHEWYHSGVANSIGGEANNITTAMIFVPASFFRFFSMTTVTGIRVRHSKEGAAQDVDFTVRGYRMTAHTHSVSGQTAQADSHSHNVTTTASASGTAHDHDFSDTDLPLEFGIFQFDGDGGDGTGAPVFGRNSALAVDPELTNGRPTTAQFDAAVHPVNFGVGGNVPQSVELDITGYLNVDPTSGVIANGEHRVWFRASQDTTHANADLRNTKGLSVVSVTPIVRLVNEGG
jgi:hypothetical protein